MYVERFRFVYYLLAILGTIAIAAVLLGPVAFGDPVRVETHYAKRPALSSSASAADARGQFSGEPQSVDGAQLGFPAGTTCDYWQLKDGVALICHS